MATKKIALDAGHGLKTPGKQTPTGIKEWTLNDKVRDKVVEMLKDYDVEIIHTDNNEGKTDESLTARLSRYRKANVDAFVSIHHNALTGKWNSATGIETYTDKNPTAADTKLAKAIHTRLVKNTKMRDRGIKKEDFYVINQDRIPAILCELGFMDNKQDYASMTSEAGQTARAKAIAEGLIEFLNLKIRVDSNAVVSLFKIKVANVEKGDVLNIRKEPNADATITGKLAYNDPNIYTIIETYKGWGKLKSGIGWVNLTYTKRV